MLRAGNTIRNFLPGRWSLNETAFVQTQSAAGGMPAQAEEGCPGSIADTIRDRKHNQQSTRCELSRSPPPQAHQHRHKKTVLDMPASTLPQTTPSMPNHATQKAHPCRHVAEPQDTPETPHARCSTNHHTPNRSHSCLELNACTPGSITTHAPLCGGAQASADELTSARAL